MGAPCWTVSELLFEKKELIPELQKLLVARLHPIYIVVYIPFLSIFKHPFLFCIAIDYLVSLAAEEWGLCRLNQWNHQEYIHALLLCGH
jgi:hypothetical protein